MLSYLVKRTHPETSYAVHQCARLYNYPKCTHGKAVKRIVRQLLVTTRNDSITKEETQGIVFKPDKTRSIDKYVHVSFDGKWNAEWSNKPTSFMLRTEYEILYVKCPTILCSRLETKILLSTTESDYIALSQSMRDVILLMKVLR